MAWRQTCKICDSQNTVGGSHKNDKGELRGKKKTKM